MKEIVFTTWLGNMAFETSIDGCGIKMATDPKAGGNGLGPRPKPLDLSALAGCTGMDVISILQKKKVIPTSFRVLIEGDLTEEHPKIYKDINIIFEITGPGYKDNQDIYLAVQRAVELSSDKYCGVSAMLKGTCTIMHEILLLNE